MNEERVKEIRERHQFDDVGNRCVGCYEMRLPCDTIELANAYESLKRERDELKAVAVALDTPIPMPTVVLTREQVSRFRNEYLALIRTSDTQSKTEAAMTHKYVSTYCLHNDHRDCRLQCKLCAAPCLCRCHLETPEITEDGK